MDERFHYFMSSFVKINHSIHRLKSDCMAPLGLKSSHFSCLYYLYNSSPVCATQLIELCQEDKGSISRTIKDLKEKGYIVTRTCLTNVYRSPLVLTEKGVKAGEEITEKITKILSQINTGLTEEETESMYKGLEVLAKNLENLSI